MKIYVLVLLILLFSCNNVNKKDLLGIWSGSLKSFDLGEKIEKITLEFTDKGDFIQTIGEGDMQNIIKLKYRTKNHKLYSTEIDSEHEDEAEYHIIDRKLILDYDGVTNEFIKIK